MSSPAKTKADASRALGQADVTFVRELEVVNELDARVLTSFVATLLRNNKKLRVFVAERISKHR